jgi:hypothetical protein
LNFAAAKFPVLGMGAAKFVASGGLRGQVINLSTADMLSILRSRQVALISLQQNSIVQVEPDRLKNNNVTHTVLSKF